MIYYKVLSDAIMQFAKELRKLRTEGLEASLLLSWGRLVSRA